MPSNTPIKETASFVQYSSVMMTDDFNPLYDIQKEPDESCETYCQKLFSKAISQSNSKIPAFISHHCARVHDPMKWLNKFEKLLSVNEEIFHKYNLDSKLMKFQTCIEFKRQELKKEKRNFRERRPPAREINAVAEERYFSFKETKLKCHNLVTKEDKTYFLTAEIYEYKTAELESINNKLPPFDEQCEKMIVQIQMLAKAKEDLKKEIPSVPDGILPYKKIRINCNVNQIVDVFYQLNRELFESGKPFIDGSVQDIVAVIVNSFEDKSGLPLSPATVETILRPSKTDKRPNSLKRIDIDKASK